MTYSLRVSLFFGALFLIYGVHLPFLPLWLEWRGLRAEEIATIVAVPYFLRLAVSPTIAYWADLKSLHTPVIIALAWVSAAAALALSQAHGFVGLLLAAVCLSLAMTSVMPLTEVVAVRGVREHGCDYGRMRLWGSLTFIVASWIAAWVVSRFGVSYVVWLVFAGAVATLAAAHLLPEAGENKHLSGAGRRSAAVAVPLSLAAVIGLVRSPVFLLFLVACGVAQAAHAAYYAFGSIHWARQGFSPEAIGLLWGIGVAAEIALFAWSARLNARVSAGGLMLLGAGASVVRWGAMAFEPGLAALFVLQFLHALTFGASHLAAIRFISEAVPSGLAGTAQALYATIAMGVAMGAATLLVGSFYEAIGGQVYLLMSGLSVAAFAAAAGVVVLWRGGDIVGENSQTR